MARWRPFVQGDSYMANKKWTPLVIGNGYTTTDGASGPAPEWETVTGNPVSFNAITPWPLKQLEVAFSPVQSGSGDPSPDNVRPISGWSSLNVWQTGKNLLNPVAKTNGFYSPSVGSALPDLTRDYSSFADNELTVNGTAWNGNGFISDRVFAGKTYEVTGALTATTPRCSIVTLDEEYKVVRNIRNIVASGEWNESITIADGEMYIGFSLVNSADSPITLANPSVSESGEYQPYNGRSISISIGETVYSGTIDLVTGEGMVTGVNVSFADLAERTWGLQPRAAAVGGNMFACQAVNLPATDLLAGDYTKAKTVEKCSHAPIDNAYGTEATCVWAFQASATSDTIIIRMNVDGLSTVNELITWLTAQTGSLYYTLRTPIPISLTPQEINSLAGDNVLFSDANGDLTVEYRSN